MTVGEVEPVTVGECDDLYYVDVGMYGVEEYGTVYIIDAERPAVVDPGTGAERDIVLDAMAEVGIEPEDLEAIALSHVHLDHAGGAGYLAETCPNATVYVHEIGTKHLVDPSRLWEGTKQAVGDMIKYYAEPQPVDEARIEEIADGDTIDIGDHELEVLYAPGHAPHQVVFYDPTNDAVFAADAAGLYTPSVDEVNVTTPPVNFDLEQALADVEMLQDLDPAVICYGHFGPAPTGDRLERYAEQLPEWVDAIAEKRAELEDDEAVIQHFIEHVDYPEVWGPEKQTAEVRLNVSGILVMLDRQAD